MSPEAAHRPAVWIVDDSRLDAERARNALAGEYAVECLPDGSVAIERLTAGPLPDVLVLDWVMPGVSGIEVCQYVRAAGPGLEKISLLLLTGHQRTEQIVEGLCAGANDYLAKPYADDELRARVAALVRTRDLVDRVAQAESALAEILEATPDALFVVDARGVAGYVNPAARRMLPLDEASGLPISQILPELSTALAAASADRPLPDVPYRDRIYSPTTRRLLWKNEPHLLVALRDVTDQRRAEARRLDFYSVVAHDLRSPMHAVLLRLGALLRGSRGPLSADLLDDLRKIDRSTRFLVNMVNDFLDIARLEASAEQLVKSEVDLAAVVADAVEELRPLIDAARLRVSTVKPDDAARVVGDPRRLSQVVSNLLGNAIKFTPPSGSIKASIEVEPSFVAASVEDDGPGIAADELPGIFERFSRAAGSTGIVGSGLGLMIARQIVEAHGGAIGVESAVGRGSRFWFRLPRALAKS
jgi:two-component system phosphate regulon sensor histidine kinase PhoR